MNQQPIEKQSKDLSKVLDVQEVFLSIQGEGPFTGHKAVFVRLAGCNLQCPQCDTDYTSRRQTYDIVDLIDKIKSLSSYGLIVITGGEPFRQNLSLFINTVLDIGAYYVQVETNGTLPPTPFINWSLKYWEKKGAYIVCSPKTGRVHPDIDRYACAFKYVVSDGDIASDGLPIHALGHSVANQVARPAVWYNKAIYVQPIDVKDEELNRLHTRAAIRSCLTYGYIFQLQVHKHIDME